jgi:hypothetical protein
MTRARPPPLRSFSRQFGIKARGGKMTENNNTEVWGEIGTPTDLWSVSKSLTFADPDEAAQAWRKTVRTLEGMCQVADALMLEPLLLAMVDAKIRAEEELERAQDRAERPEGVQLSEREDERLMTLMRRSDALGTACTALEDWGVDPKDIADVLEILTEMKTEAHEAFLRYRREIGLPE